MKVIVTGATGFIGREVVNSLLATGDAVVGLTRSPERARARLPNAVEVLGWSPPGVAPEWAAKVEEADAVVNLAGEPVVDKRWTPEQKERIRSSRVDATVAVVEAIRRADRRPKVLVSGSAVGYYGSRAGLELRESVSPGTDFLARLVVDWEAAATGAEELGVRVVLVRTGSMVLGKSGGALPRLALPFRLYGGGLLGQDDQWISWIHVQDEVGVIRLAVAGDTVTGPINACAPNPVSMADFARALGRALDRPVWFPGLPSLLRLMLGQRAQVLAASQRQVADKLLSLGFQFRHPDLDEALTSLLKQQTTD